MCRSDLVVPMTWFGSARVELYVLYIALIMEGEDLNK